MEYSKIIAKRAKELQENGVQFTNNVENDKVYITQGDLLERDLTEAIKEINKANPNIVLEKSRVDSKTTKLTIQEIKVQDGVLHKSHIVNFYNDNVLTYSTYDVIEKCKEIIENKKGAL